LILRIALRLREILDRIFRDDDPDQNVMDPPGSRPMRERDE
jgi:hypothetical protein